MVDFFFQTSQRFVDVGEIAVTTISSTSVPTQGYGRAPRVPKGALVCGLRVQGLLVTTSDRLTDFRQWTSRAVRRVRRAREVPRLLQHGPAASRSIASSAVDWSSAVARLLESKSSGGPGSSPGLSVARSLAIHKLPSQFLRTILEPGSAWNITIHSDSNIVPGPFMARNSRGDDGSGAASSGDLLSAGVIARSWVTAPCLKIVPELRACESPLWPRTHSVLASARP